MEQVKTIADELVCTFTNYLRQNVSLLCFTVTNNNLFPGSQSKHKRRESILLVG